MKRYPLRTIHVIVCQRCRRLATDNGPIATNAIADAGGSGAGSIAPVVVMVKAEVAASLYKLPPPR